MSLDLLARKIKEDARNRELKRCQEDLYFLCAEVLGYAWDGKSQQGMTEEFHGPLCARMDRLREHPRILTLAPRKHLKTTVFTIGLAIQEILRDPNITILIPHAVEDEASKIVSEIVNHFKNNKRLRSLRPEIFPAPNGKWWWGANKMTVRREKFSRQPTVLGVGAGSEIGGAHCDLILPDDIVGRRTLENSELPKIASWWQNTVTHVLNNNGRIRGVGTRWHPDDTWQDFIDSGLWDVCVRACSEIDGQPDYTIQNPVHFGPDPGDRERAIERLRVIEIESKGDFASQMMNDPSPASEKPWDRETCEHPVTAEYVKGAGAVYVIHDPAPSKVGSLDFTGAKNRKDGSKDPWAIAVVKLRRKGDRKEIILVDLDESKEWDLDSGLRRGFELCRKWGARRVAIEAVGTPGKIYEDRARVIAREEGVKYTPVTLTQTYKGKNLRFGALASRAKADEFLIGDTVPTTMRDKFLAQAREWRPLESGGNSLKYDDLADVVSYATDPAIDVYEMDEMMREWSPYRSAEHDELAHGSRYVHW